MYLRPVLCLHLIPTKIPKYDSLDFDVLRRHFSYSALQTLLLYYLCVSMEIWSLLHFPRCNSRKN